MFRSHPSGEELIRGIWKHGGLSFVQISQNCCCTTSVLRHRMAALNRTPVEKPSMTFSVFPAPVVYNPVITVSLLVVFCLFIYLFKSSFNQSSSRTPRPSLSIEKTDWLSNLWIFRLTENGFLLHLARWMGSEFRGGRLARSCDACVYTISEGVWQHT